MPGKRNATQQMQHNKKALIEALEKSLGVVTTACKSVGVDRTTFYRYYNEDIEFKAIVDSVDDIALDFVESQNYKLIRDGNPAATIFFLKTKGRKRGYIERTEHTGADGQPLIPTKITIEIIGDTAPVTREEDIKDPTE